MVGKYAERCISGEDEEEEEEEGWKQRRERKSLKRNAAARNTLFQSTYDNWTKGFQEYLLRSTGNQGITM